MINKKINFLSLFLVIFFTVSSLTGCERTVAVHADYPYYKSINDSKNSADMIVSGKVIKVNKGPEDKNIESSKKVYKEKK